MKLFFIALIAAATSSLGAMSWGSEVDSPSSGLDQDLNSYYHTRRLIGLHRSMAYHRGALSNCPGANVSYENSKSGFDCPYLMNSRLDCPNCKRGLSSNPFGKLAKMQKRGEDYRNRKNYEVMKKSFLMNMRATKMMMGYKGKSWGPSKWKTPAHPAHPSHEHHNAYIKLKLLKMMILQISTNESAS